MPRTSSRKKPKVDYGADAVDSDPPKRSRTTARAAIKEELAADTDPPESKKRKAEADSHASGEDEAEAAPLPKKRKSKGKPQDSMTPLAARTAVASLKKAMYIGAHVSAAGGMDKAIGNAVHIGANAFALFLKSQRKWVNPDLSDETRQLFVDGCRTHAFAPAKHALPHGSYLVNLAQADEAKAAQAYSGFLDDLQRCERLGIRLYNFHPGSTGGEERGAAIARIAAQLNRAHAETAQVVTVLENMAGGGNHIGSTWEDLRDVIGLIEDKARVGVCIDTCHAFAAGYDLRSPEAFEQTMRSFDDIVGAKYLKAFHLNDSKAPFDSKRDLHANIGTGFLGLRAFHSIVNDDRFRGLPMVLETPIDRVGADGKTVEDKLVWADEIKLLESLIGMDPSSPSFREKEQELQDKGRAERKKLQAQADKKTAKAVKKAAKGAGGGRKKKNATKEESDEESD